MVHFQARAKPSGAFLLLLSIQELAISGRSRLERLICGVCFANVSGVSSILRRDDDTIAWDDRDQVIVVSSSTTKLSLLGVVK